MRTDFDRLWEDRLVPVLESVRSERLKLVRRRTHFSCFGLVAGAAAALLTWLFVREWHIAATAFGGAAIGYTAGWLHTNEPVRALSEALKSRTNTVTANAFGLGYCATARGAPDYHRFRDLALVPAGQLRSDIGDWFVGEGRSGEFEFFELRLCAERNGMKMTCFHGILVRLPLARRIEGITVIALDQGDVGNAVDAAWRRAFGDGLERVRLVDGEFEALFEIYGDDQVAARYMLTPTVMEGLKRVECRFRDQNMRIAVDAGSGDAGAVLVALETGDLFDPENPELDLFDKNHHQRVHAEIAAIVDLVDLFQRELDPVDAHAHGRSELA